MEKKVHKNLRQFVLKKTAKVQIIIHCFSNFISNNLSKIHTNVHKEILVNDGHCGKTKKP